MAVLLSAMVAPLLILLSLKRMYAFNTSLTGRYLTVLYLPCALFWARWLAERLAAADAFGATGSRWSMAARVLLALFAAAVVGSDIEEYGAFFRGDDRRWALSNAVPRQKAAALARPRFHALTDDAAASSSLLERLSSPEPTEAEALRIRRVLFGR